MNSNPCVLALPAARRWLRLVAVLIGCAGAVAPAWADSCGRSNERPCTITERVPSCDANLVESAALAQCVRPACGAEGQPTCTVLQRTGFDFVLQLPVPQACDWNLKVDKGVCTHPACGREGERACDVLTRLPSCDLDLIENQGRCRRPPHCGGVGQALCDIFVRGPLRRCDANLVDVGGQCGRPGNPDAPANTAGASSTSSALTSATPPPAPAPAPRANAAPAPAPAPRANAAPLPAPAPAMAAPAPAARLNMTAPRPVLHAAAPVAAAVAGMETDTDRAGADFAGFDVAADPAQCQARCTGAAQCVAWTYVKPGVQAPSARCYLKSSAPAPTRNACCVSGTRSAPSLLKLSR